MHRPFQRENESWAELVVRTGRAIIDIAYRHAGETVVLVGHSETVNSSFHVLGMQPLLRAFDTALPAGLLRRLQGREGRLPALVRQPPVRQLEVRPGV
ncbi:histidine phosphatase family protein [Catellatospora aurea]|uniref:Histidine phosphatase family protein n=1 Tax=Catellatospora aurea TaxID=1337874 RepID=A0ABW2GV35_9ACTN